MRTISWRIVDVQRRGLYERSATRRDSQGGIMVMYSLMVLVGRD